MELTRHSSGTTPLSDSRSANFTSKQCGRKLASLETSQAPRIALLFDDKSATRAVALPLRHEGWAASGDPPRPPEEVNGGNEDMEEGKPPPLE